MVLSPRLYKFFVRPGWFVDFYINNALRNEYDFSKKMVLDFGCGIGTSCCLFQPDNYLGIDSDPKRVNYAKNLHSAHRFIVISEPKIPVLENSFDYVLVISVLHHIPTEVLPSYLSEFSRVLKSDGKVLVCEPCYFENHTISNLCMRYFDRGKYIQTKDGYLSLFQKNNYYVETYKEYSQLRLYNKLFFSAEPVNKNS